MEQNHCKQILSRENLSELFWKYLIHFYNQITDQNVCINSQLKIFVVSPSFNTNKQN